MSLRLSLLVVILAELLYLAVTRLVIHHYGTISIPGELLRGALRLASATVCWKAFKPLILSRTPKIADISTPTEIIALLLFLAVPLLVSHPQYPFWISTTFALTSLLVGIKEEILFRGILQNALSITLNNRTSVLISSAIFTVWHFGAVPSELGQFVEIFLASLVMGVVYKRSGSLLVVILLHAAYDALFFLPSPLTGAANSVLVLGAMLPACLYLLMFREKGI